MRRGALLALLLAAPPALAAREQLALTKTVLDLPGPPAAIVPADLDGDGRQDLLAVVVYTAWGEIGTDRWEGAMQIAEVVPAIFDRREARVWLGGSEGGWTAGAPLPLPASVLTVEAGPPGLPAIALTDEGVSVFRYSSTLGLTLEPVLADPPVLAGTGTFLSGLHLVGDLDGDRVADLLLPARGGLTVYRGTGAGLAPEGVPLPTLPGERRVAGRARRVVPLPETLDVDGDGRLDLVIRELQAAPVRRERGKEKGKEGGQEDASTPPPPAVHVLSGRGEGRFSAPRTLDLGPLALGKHRTLAWLGDLDGTGPAEAVTLESLDGDAGGMKEAKRPRLRYRFHHLSADGTIVAAPFTEGVFEGHADLDPEGGELSMGSFLDLDGDGRRELITVGLDFSVFQLVRVMTTKKISIGLEFLVHRQGGDGRFTAVPGLDLAETLKIDLDELDVRAPAQFAGDFDGDGRRDFVHLGRGKTVTIHRGEEGARYPKQPDLAIELDEPLEGTGQVRIEDLDGDGRADLAVVRPLPAPDDAVSAPVRLDVYASRGAR